MASRSGYTFERMREIGRRSADQARSTLEWAVFARLKALTCEYCGVVKGGSVGLGVQAMLKDMGFELSLEVLTDA